MHESISKPSKSHFIDLALQGGEMGREDCQDGWHLFLNDVLIEDHEYTVLDVGSGLGLSKHRILNCTTQDPAPVNADIHVPISDLHSKSYDVVTCFDVIEHVVEDLEFMADMIRIARKFVFITTPNENVSHAANGCHVREYSPEEFFNLVPSGLDFRLFVGDGRGLFPKEINEDYGERFCSHNEPHQAVLIRTEKP